MVWPSVLCPHGFGRFCEIKIKRLGELPKPLFVALHAFARPIFSENFKPFP